MDEIITCTILGIASIALGDTKSNPSGRETWTGVRVRTPDGKARFFKSMLVEAEASIILHSAMDRGEQVEMWLTGKTERPYPYAIRTTSDAWYNDSLGREFRFDALKIFLIGVLLLPVIGIGVLGLIASIGILWSSFTFSARHSRETFDLGYEAGVLRRSQIEPLDGGRQAA